MFDYVAIKMFVHTTFHSFYCRAKEGDRYAMFGEETYLSSCVLLASFQEGK